MLLQPPLQVAQDLAGLDGQVTSVSVKAVSSDAIDALSGDLASSLPDLEVSTQSELASQVSGSLATATNLVTTISLWVTIAALALALLISALLTLSSVNRRTRELGTLKAIGWRGRTIVGEIVAESGVRAFIGALVGTVVAVAVIVVVNLVAPTVGGATAEAAGGQGMPGGESQGGPAQAGGFPGGGMATSATSAAANAAVQLQVPFDVSLVVGSILVAVAGGILAGAIGAARAARLRPAVALRSVS